MGLPHILVERLRTHAVGQWFPDLSWGRGTTIIEQIAHLLLGRLVDHIHPLGMVKAKVSAET